MAKAKTYTAQNEAIVRGVMRRLTRAPKLIIEAAAQEALQTAIEITVQDSGNAAWHWTIVGFRGSDVPDIRRVPFGDRRGQSPIGNRGDGGMNAEAVRDAALRDGYKVIHDMVWVQGRVAFTIFNDIVNEGSKQYQFNAGVTPGIMTKVAEAALERARLAASKARSTADSIVPNHENI